MELGKREASLPGNAHAAHIILGPIFHELSATYWDLGRHQDSLAIIKEGALAFPDNLIIQFPISQRREDTRRCALCPDGEGELQSDSRKGAGRACVHVR